MHPYDHPCSDCGKIIHSVKYINGQRTLTVRCRQCQLAFNVGVNSWAWKGGRNINWFGYVDIHMPEHPDADVQGYVREHRIVMEKVLGRFLEKTEIIHHINGDKADNRPENLVVTTAQKHPSYHIASRICSVCGKEGQTSNGMCQHHYREAWRRARGVKKHEHRVCKICGGKHRSNGYCKKHYAKFVWGPRKKELHGK